MQNEKEMKLITIANEQVIDALDNNVMNGISGMAELSSFRRTLTVATVIENLRSILTPKIMEPIMALQNTSLGFKTDQKERGYPLDIVRDCLIDACLRGVYPVGNEFNIIAGNCYITKEGFAHKLRDVAGLSYTITPGLPKLHGDSGAVIPMEVEWTYGGKTQTKELQLAIRVNKMMGADAIIGKATRKARAWLHTTVTGQEIGDGDADGGAFIDVESSAVDASTPKKASPFETIMDESASKAASGSALEK